MIIKIFMIFLLILALILLMFAAFVGFVIAFSSIIDWKVERDLNKNTLTKKDWKNMT